MNEEMKKENTNTISVGDCVKVVHCFHGHEFEIGEIVCIVEAMWSFECWFCRNSKGVEWYMQCEEFDAVNCH
jgi:hypothetical protein